MGQAEDVPQAGHDGEAVVRENAAAATVADGSEVGEGPVRGEIDFGGVVEDEDDGVFGHGLAGEWSVGVWEVVHGGGLRIAEVVEGALGRRRDPGRGGD